ncbi:hypothetical protein DP73_16355 [Desulfosporosinus sp. HMP52]|uniref:hypothetical protein n=1 Tax=Desulfosporosinus sp. HMP52 TaxID=1487923 RepID=UPI00051FE231|nr:hypothetical protein [Desulfosporosinus sp. HMP52]KGK86492.1 hypothetical protein DP73_16355 [Desulfosporosinus sp. HMP52]
MEIFAQDLKLLIKEGSNLIQTGSKIQNSQCIHWYLKCKSALDSFAIEKNLLDKFKYSLELEERVEILKKIAHTEGEKA